MMEGRHLRLSPACEAELAMVEQTLQVEASMSLLQLLSNYCTTEIQFVVPTFGGIPKSIQFLLPADLSFAF